MTYKIADQFRKKKKKNNLTHLLILRMKFFDQIVSRKNEKSELYFQQILYFQKFFAALSEVKSKQKTLQQFH